MVVGHFCICYYNKLEIEMFELSSYPSNFEKSEGDVVRLYEQIVVKNFQILKSILPKMNSLYQFNQELERNVSRIETRLIKMENDNQNLHYQMRTSHLAIDSKLNGIIEQYNYLTNQTSKFKKQTQFLTKQIREAKNRQKIQQDERKILEKQLQNQPKAPKITEKIVDKQAQDQQKGQQQQIQQNCSNKYIKKQKKNVEFVRKKSTSIDNQENQETQPPKVHFNFTSKPKVSDKAESIQVESQINTQILGESLTNSRKTNLKGNKSIGRSQKIIKAAKVSEVDDHNKKLDKFLKQIQNYHFHNEKMKKNYEELMEKYEQANQLNFAQVRERISELDNRLNNLDPSTINIDKINIQLSNQLQSISKTYAHLQAQIVNKIDKASFDKIMNDFNTRFFGIHQERKKLANRDQTKKAFEFLQKKVNSMLTEYYQVKRKSLHHVSVDKKGCLRVDIYEKKGDKDLSRENIIQPNSPQTIRQDGSYRSKRQAESLHSRIANGTLTENRFNQNKWRPICTEKIAQQEETSRKQQNSISLSLLKKKSFQILQKDKVRVRPRLKKERLIFQYD